MTGTPTILVAGTNGKGTTTGYVWQLAVASGLRAGLFTSPHLWRFAERIQHSHVALDEPALVAELEALEADLPGEVFAPLSFFELTTLMALRLFARLGTDVMAFEVGLGGRWDASNVTDPAVSVITSIGLDHQEYLGSTAAAIAGEKAGIMRPGRPVLFGGSDDPSVRAVIEEEARRRGALLAVVGREIRLQADAVTIDIVGAPRVEVPWPRVLAEGPGFLRRNFALAVAAYHVWRQDGPGLVGAVGRLDRGEVPIPPSHWARFQRLVAAPAGFAPRPVLVDVAHNPDGARALVAGLGETGLLATGKLPALVSILRDKDHAVILATLRNALVPVGLFRSSSERTFRPEDLQGVDREVPFFEDFRGAWAALPPDDGRPVVITGSVHALGQVLEAFGVSPLQRPR